MNKDHNQAQLEQAMQAQACNPYQPSITTRWSELRSGWDQQQVANQSARVALSVLRDYLSIADQQALESLLMKAGSEQTQEYRRSIMALLGFSRDTDPAPVIQTLAELDLHSGNLYWVISVLIDSRK